MIDTDRKIAFFHPARTGGTSVEQMIIKKYGKNIWTFKEASNIQYWKNIGVDNTTKHHNAQHFNLSQVSIPEDFIKFATVRCPYRRAVSMYSYLAFDREKLNTFESFYNNFGTNYWTVPQHLYTHKNDEMYVDRIVKICDGEDINSRWLSELLECELIDINKRPKKLELIDSDIKFINKIYKKDFELLGYQMIK